MKCLETQRTHPKGGVSNSWAHLWQQKATCSYKNIRSNFKCVTFDTAQLFLTVHFTKQTSRRCWTQLMLDQREVSLLPVGVIALAQWFMKSRTIHAQMGHRYKYSDQSQGNLCSELSVIYRKMHMKTVITIYRLKKWGKEKPETDFFFFLFSLLLLIFWLQHQTEFSRMWMDIQPSESSINIKLLLFYMIQLNQEQIWLFNHRYLIQPQKN